MDQLDIAQSRRVIFIVLLVVIIPSIICSIYIFYNFIRIRELRQRTNNHVILLLLMITFLQVTSELPLSLNHLRTGSAALFADGFCQFWIVFNYMTNTGSLWTMAIANIQRYFIIFHRLWVDQHKIWFSHIPLFCCVVYPIILYSYLVLKYNCVNVFDYSQWTCGGACYLYEPLLGTLDWVINGCSNVFLSLMATIVIIIRIIIQRHRIASQRSVWRRTRRMFLQLIPLSILFLLAWLPSVICFVITLFQPNPILSSFYANILSYYQYVSSLFCPFVCLLSLPEVRQKLENFRRIHPKTQLTTAGNTHTNQHHRSATHGGTH